MARNANGIPKYVHMKTCKITLSYAATSGYYIPLGNSRIVSK